MGWGFSLSLKLDNSLLSLKYLQIHWKEFHYSLKSKTFVDHSCYVCLVFVMLSRLFIVTLWSPAGKGMTFWLLFVMFNCVLSLSHVISWVRCGT